MKPEERDHLLNLCHRIHNEHDPDRFTELICELEALLDFFHPAEELELPLAKAGQ